MEQTNDVDVLDILIAFIKGCRYKNEIEKYGNCIHSLINEKDYWIWNADYLLNQLLRQVDVPPERQLVSKGAKEMWGKLKPKGPNGDSLEKYYYREVLEINNDLDEEVGLYKGAEKNPSSKIKIKKGEKFIFNDIFHYEHTVPIHVIKSKLLELRDEELTKENISEILNKMYTCRMLKSEDRNIDPKYKKTRPIEIDQILETVYKGII